MKNIAPFINLGWHTVPLKGELKRLPDGSKTLPIFEKAWKEKYANTKNEIQSQLGGTLTGRISNIVAIDCDNDVTYELFKSLHPEYEFVFMSKGKAGKVCGTFIYEFDEAFADRFSINDGELALDFYSDDGFVYLPTDANETKEAWAGKLPNVEPMPYATKVLLSRLLKSTAASAAAPVSRSNIMTANCLAPLVKQFTTERKFLPGLFRIITPKDFRTEPQYLREGFLHPENVSQGNGSAYLVRVSAILGADISIDEELYCAAMNDINALWPDPMESTKLESTILDPMIQGKASIDGVPIWQYDEQWAQYRSILNTKRQSSIELGFDDHRNMYYCVDVANEHIKAFARDTDYMAYITSVAVSPPKKPDLKQLLPIINVVSVPNRPFGFFADADPTARTLNTFIRTPELCIMEHPEEYAKMYKRPNTTLQFLETLVPEEKMRTFLIQFMKRKLTTFDYSPVVLYFLGKPGSGKDTFVALIEKIMGKVARPTTKEFLELFNGWLLDTYFVQLDEYGNQLVTHRDREEALGKLKAYTGKSVVQVRQMRNDGFNYKHSATFIATANSNPFGIEDGDRRIALFHTPNVLLDASWVDDMSAVYEQIMRETCDFCYYLATEVEDLPNDQYTKPPESEKKNELIADNMYAAQRIAFVLKNGMFDYLSTLAHDYACPKVVEAIKKGRIRAKDLEELYDMMTDFKGEMRSLNKAIRMNGIELKATTTDGAKDYYYVLDTLVYDNSPFTADDDDDA